VGVVPASGNMFAAGCQIWLGKPLLSCLGCGDARRERVWGHCDYCR
jgi:hypothetical protein